MKVVIHTQFMENYGAHDWDGEGECPSYWKFKGGDSFVIRGVGVSEAMNMKETMKEIASLIEYSDDYSREYIIDWSIEEDDAAECEAWETAWTITKSDDGFIASRYEEASEYTYWRDDVLSKTESYTMKPAGERDNYSCDYAMKAEAVA